jgi:hypothetical protein
VTGGDWPLDTLSRHERSALRELLVRAVTVADWSTDGGLAPLVAAAPVHALPAAAALHRVSGSVRRALDRVDGVPADVRTQLEAEERVAALHHLVIVGALSTIANSFDDAGLTWAVMKGPVVAALLYRGIGDRRYGDLDLLVDQHGFGPAVRILEDLGYGHTIHDWSRAEQMLAGEIGMASPTVSVDLHWHLHYSREDRRQFALDPRAMLERVRHVDVSGLAVPTFDRVDTLLTLAFHAARSDGHRLIWLKDVERALDVDQPDVDELIDRCHTFRCAPPVGLVLARARRMLGAQVSRAAIDGLVPRSLQVIDWLSCRAVDPIQLHEHDTVTRALTRSARSSLADSVADLPLRTLRWAHPKLFPPPPNETDDRDEQERYFRAVAGSAG